MPAYIVRTDYFDNTVIDTHGDFTQKLQYRAQCVKERSYSTAPITSAINMHTMCTPTFTERERERESKRGMRRGEREREREQERDEKRRKRENTNTMYG
jgi:hypothetical protein